jgi:hypothetical protein
MTLLPFALRALDQGFHIFPCEPGEKQGALVRPGQPWRIRWAQVATNDLTRVVNWWARQPMYNPAVACKPSGILVMDCDVPKEDWLLKDTAYAFLHDELGPRVDGTWVMQALCADAGATYAEVTDTYRVRTTRGGLHLYYQWPEDIRSSQASIAKGVLDVRCNGGTQGGYVLAAGAQTPAGPYVVDCDVPIRPAPDFLVQAVMDKPPVAREQRLYIPPFQQPARAGTGNYSGLIDTVRYAIDGNLNNSLLWAARSMCSDGATTEEAVELLAPVYVECNGRGGYRQAEATIRSAYRLQQVKEV